MVATPSPVPPAGARQKILDLGQAVKSLADDVPAELGGPPAWAQAILASVQRIENRLDVMDQSITAMKRQSAEQMLRTRLALQHLEARTANARAAAYDGKLVPLLRMPDLPDPDKGQELPDEMPLKNAPDDFPESVIDVGRYDAHRLRALLEAFGAAVPQHANGKEEHMDAFLRFVGVYV